MSYGIVRIQKFKREAVKGIELHDQRAKEVSHTNPDIDHSKSDQNYALAGNDADYLREVAERINKLSGKAVRKDAVVMCQALITSDSTFFQKLSQEQQREFFKQSLNFIRSRYGEENILSATVHMDERTPHMHVNFTPICNGKLSAFKIFTRQELRDLHTDFYNSVGKIWDLERGESGENKKFHLSVADYKRETLRSVKAELEKTKEELEQTKKELDTAKSELLNFRDIQKGTAHVLAQAQAWSIEKARQEKEKIMKERERQQEIERQKREKKAQSCSWEPEL